jgi:hypothetical protein
MFFRPENCINIVQLQARNLSEFFSVKKRKQVQINSVHLRGASSRYRPIQCFQHLQISYVSQILQWIPTKPNDGEAKGSLLELFQKDFLKIYHWRKVVFLSHLDLSSNQQQIKIGIMYCEMVKPLPITSGNLRQAC